MDGDPIALDQSYDRRQAIDVGDDHDEHLVFNY